MFARFRLPDGEINVNVNQVRFFQPGADEGSTKLVFTDGPPVEVPVSNRSVRNAFKKALGANTASDDAE